MDLAEKCLEHEAQIPLVITYQHDTDALEGQNTLLTLQTNAGPRDVVLLGWVADPDRFYAAASAKHPHVLDVALTERDPTTNTTPAQFLAGGLIAH